MRKNLHTALHTAPKKALCVIIKPTHTTHTTHSTFDNSSFKLLFTTHTTHTTHSTFKTLCLSFCFTHTTHRQNANIYRSKTPLLTLHTQHTPLLPYIYPQGMVITSEG